MNMQQDNLPKGWEYKKLKDICEKITDGTHQTPKYFESGFIFLSSRNVTSGKINWDDVKYIDEVQHYEMQKRVSPKKGDILLAKNGTTGVAALVDKDAVFDIYVSLALLRSKGEVLPEFLLHFINSPVAKSQFNKRLKGIGVPNLHLEEIREVDISFPKSLPEQQRIVSILDEAIAAIAKAKANAEQNLKNAKELFESYLQGVFENGDWETKTIQEISKVVNGYAFASKDFKPTNTIKSIKITNVGVKEFVEESDNYLPEKLKEILKDFQVREGNIVIALTRTIISAGLKVAVVPASYDGALINQRVAALVPNEKLVNQNFLYYYLTTNGVAKYVLEHVNTLMQPNLSINDLKNLHVPIPSFQLQQSIVSQLDALRMETQKLEAVYRKKIADLEELKKSLLKKAFSGEL